MTMEEPVDPSRPDQNSAWQEFNALLIGFGGVITPEERAVVDALELSDLDKYEIELLSDLLQHVVARVRPATRS